MHTFQCSSTNAGMHNICTKGHSFPLAQKVRRFDPIVVLTASHRSAFFSSSCWNPLLVCAVLFYLCSKHIPGIILPFIPSIAWYAEKKAPKGGGRKEEQGSWILLTCCLICSGSGSAPRLSGPSALFFSSFFSLLSVGHSGAVRRPVELTDYHVGSMEAK